MTLRDQQALERRLMEVLLRSIRPALDGAVHRFCAELTEVLRSSPVRDGAPGGGQLGRKKHCTVCGLEGARNDAALAANHSEDEHRRWKAGLRPRSVGRRRHADAA